MTMRTKLILGGLILLGILIIVFIIYLLQDDVTPVRRQTVDLNSLTAEQIKMQTSKKKEASLKNPEDKEWFDLPEVSDLMLKLEQFDVIRTYTHAEPKIKMDTSISEDFKNQANKATSIVSGTVMNFEAKYYIILSDTDVIHSAAHHNIVIAPIVDNVTSKKATYQGFLVPIKLNGEDGYVIAHNIRSVPKLVVVNLYGKISNEDIQKVKDEFYKEFEM